MGGAKKPRPVKQEKTKDSKKKPEGGPKRAEIIVIVNEQQAMKAIKGSKLITVHDLARQAGVKLSAANAFLRDAKEKGIVDEIGGYSGHRIYKESS